MGDGEDGPTHQPVEQLISLRAIPGLVVLRPADANEVVEAYRYIMQLRHQPAVLALSRQPLPTFDRSKYASAAGVARGAYVMADAPGGRPGDHPDRVGQRGELSSIEAHETLASPGRPLARRLHAVMGHFRAAAAILSRQVLPPAVTARVAVEQGSVLGWERYVGAAGRVIGMKTFGASAPLKELQRKFGFEPERVVAVAKELLGRK